MQSEFDLEDEGPTILKLDDLSSIAPWGSLLNQFDFADAMRAQITEAELHWSVGRLTAMMLLVGAFSLAILSSLGLLPSWLSFLLACGCALLPYAYVLRRRAKRFRQFEQQFPDALDFLARSLRAGHPLPMCLELLAQEEAPPLSIEMRKTADERRLGLPLDQALDNLSKRHAAAERARLCGRREVAEPHRREAQRSAGRHWRKTCVKRRRSRARFARWRRTAASPARS